MILHNVFQFNFFPQHMSLTRLTFFKLKTFGKKYSGVCGKLPHKKSLKQGMICFFKFLDSSVRSEQSAASKLGFTMTLCIVLVVEKP